MKTRHGEREPQKRFLPAERFRDGLVVHGDEFLFYARRVQLVRRDSGKCSISAFLISPCANKSPCKTKPCSRFWTTFMKTWSCGIQAAAGGGRYALKCAAPKSKPTRQARLSRRVGFAAAGRAQRRLLRPARAAVSCRTNCGATRKCCRSRANFLSRENWSPSSVTAVDSDLGENPDAGASPVRSHQGRSGKRRRPLGERTGGGGRQPDFQPHARDLAPFGEAMVKFLDASLRR